MPRKKMQAELETMHEDNGVETAEQSGTEITKKEAVRRALAEGNATAATGVPFIKEQFGLDVKPQQYSAYKGELGATKKKGKGGRPKKRGPKLAGVAAPVPVVAAAVAEFLSVTKHEGGIDLDTIRQVKELCGRYGAETVKRLVSLLG